MVYFLCALVLVNCVAFVLMGVDKRRAIRSQWRIPERTLMLWAACGGAWGAYIGMRTFRHKTRTPKFSLGVPLLCAAQTAVFAYIYYFA